MTSFTMPPNFPGPFSQQPPPPPPQMPLSQMPQFSQQQFSPSPPIQQQQQQPFYRQAAPQPPPPSTSPLPTTSFTFKSYILLFAITSFVTLLILIRWAPAFVSLPPSIISSTTNENNTNTKIAIFPGLSYPYLFGTSLGAGSLAVVLSWLMRNDQTVARRWVKNTIGIG